MIHRASYNLFTFLFSELKIQDTLYHYLEGASVRIEPLNEKHEEHMAASHNNSQRTFN